MSCFLWVLVRSKAWGDDRGEEAAGADGLEMNLDISLRSIRHGTRTVLSSLSPSHGRSVWSRGREHRDGSARWERWWRQVPGGSQPRTANNGNETTSARPGMFPISESSA